MFLLECSQKINSTFHFSRSKPKSVQFQTFYNNIVYSFDYSSVLCTRCNDNHWSFHASYSRRFDFLGQKVRIMVTRIICNTCHITHVVLIDETIPFSSFFYNDLIQIINDDYDLITPYEIAYFKKKIRNNSDCFYHAICRLFARNCPCLFIST